MQANKARRKKGTELFFDSERSENSGQTSNYPSN